MAASLASSRACDGVEGRLDEDWYVDAFDEAVGLAAPGRLTAPRADSGVGVLTSRRAVAGCLATDAGVEGSGDMVAA